ncbi:MAG: hypothetical protein JRI89_14185, partial [Deltaproteobacteria bacterium]|nr:hypothetical protein [Deltaproteobacteria bacterium]
MQTILQTYLAEAKIGRKQSYRNLAVFPLLSGYAAALDYITLDEALAADLLEVMEKNESGSVPELKVVNKSPRMVLIVDGEELVGAKQNRIVNTTMLLRGNSTTVIPVSCVEQGRWEYESRRFSSRQRIMCCNLRAMKAEQVSVSVRASRGFQADQGALWHEIANKAARMAAESPTMAMTEIYDKEQSSLSEYLKHFRLVEMQVGGDFYINGRVVGLDSFGKSATFAGVFKKLLESYALDAIDWYEKKSFWKAVRSNAAKFL